MMLHAHFEHLAAHVACGQNNFIRNKTRHATDVCRLVWSDMVVLCWCVELPECTFCKHMLQCASLDCMCVCFLFMCIFKVKFSLRSVLSADRVEQMAKTYNDIEVVTHLLAEVCVPSLAAIFFFYKETASCWLIKPGCVVLLLDRGTETWSWQLGSVSHCCRGTTCFRNAMRP